MVAVHLDRERFADTVERFFDADVRYTSASGVSPRYHDQSIVVNLFDGTAQVSAYELADDLWFHARSIELAQWRKNFK